MGKMLCADQLHNVNFLLGLFLDVYFIDFVLARQVEDDTLDTDEYLIITKNRRRQLLIVIAGLVVPHIVGLWVDYARISWKVGGLSRMTLEKSMLLKFLNYSEESRDKFHHSDVVMAMTRDV